MLLSVYYVKLKNDMRLHLFYKQLGSGLRPQSCLYFQGFRSSKLLNGCLVFDKVTYVSEEYNNFQDSRSIFMILKFSQNPFKMLNFGVLPVYCYFFWCIAGLFLQLFYFYYKGRIPLFLNLAVFIVA